jgi:Ion transport protein
MIFINLCIVVNTACLALDYYPNNPELQGVLSIFNIVFFAIFFLEMVVKIIGLGPVDFIRDFYNIFDALIGNLMEIIVYSDLKYS